MNTIKKIAKLVCAILIGLPVSILTIPLYIVILIDNIYNDILF